MDSATRDELNRIRSLLEQDMTSELQAQQITSRDFFNLGRIIEELTNNPTSLLPRMRMGQIGRPDFSSVLQMIEEVLNERVYPTTYVELEFESDFSYLYDSHYYNDDHGEEEVEDTRITVPTSESTILGLKRVRVEEEEMCSICLENMVTEEVAGKMTCSHIYHETCIIRWLRRSRSCPLCRDRMSAA